MKKLLIGTVALLQITMALPSMAETVQREGAFGQIKGEATFEHRTGVMPGTMQPTEYWSLVVHSDGVKYEFAQAFAMNNPDRPDSIEVQGNVVHPGDQVTIGGRIQKIKKDFGLLSEVGKVRVVHQEN